MTSSPPLGAAGSPQHPPLAGNDHGAAGGPSDQPTDVAAQTDVGSLKLKKRLSTRSTPMLLATCSAPRSRAITKAGPRHAEDRPGRTEG